LSFLLDTCVISDIAKKADAGLLEWATAQDSLSLYLSELTLGEIEKGIQLLPYDHPKRQGLDDWCRHDLPRQFGPRLLPLLRNTIFAWGRLAAEGQRSGRPLSVIDGLLLAAARVHDLTFVTRNTRDLEGRGVAVVSPYDGHPPNSSRGHAG
jgi:predicted nucleic acid-binding protein